MLSTLLFSKPPKALDAKTRLRKALPEDLVQELHHEFVHDSLNLLLSVHGKHFAAWSTDSLEFIDKEPLSVYETFHHFKQSGDTFGERLHNSLKIVQKANPSSSLLLIGSDCPYLTESLIAESVSKIEEGMLVIGPSPNKGFYLLGIPASHRNTNIAHCFSNKNERKEVLNQFQNVEIHFTQNLTDIDEPKDFENLIQNIGALSSYSRTKIFLEQIIRSKGH